MAFSVFPTKDVNMSDDEHAVFTLRNLIFDICNQNGGGHGGSAIGIVKVCSLLTQVPLMKALF